MLDDAAADDDDDYDDFDVDDDDDDECFGESCQGYCSCAGASMHLCA